MNNRIAGFIAFERLEPCAGKLACTVLRGAGSSNIAGLLDFAYLGQQYKVSAHGDDYWIDLLFFHVKLNCYIVVELKTTEFKPEYAGKLNFYLSLVDDHLKEKNHNPTIGILLCKHHKKYKAEYALRNISSPIGVSEYQLIKHLPEKLKTELPTIEELEAELDNNKYTF